MAETKLRPSTRSEERFATIAVRIMSAVNTALFRASDAEKAALWPQLVAIYPDYDDYQARTDRNIPVMILSPRR